MLFKNKIVFCCLLIICIIISSSSIHSLSETEHNFSTSYQKIDSYDSVLISDEDPYFGIIGACYACRYRSDQENILVPLLVVEQNQYSNKHHSFLESFDNHHAALVIGELDNISSGDYFSFSGSAADISLDLAQSIFSSSDTALILPYSSYPSYELSIISSPIASFLNCPVLLFDDNAVEINSVLSELNVEQIYVVGTIDESFSEFDQVRLYSTEEVWKFQLDLIKKIVNKTEYITLTNPSDVKPLSIIQTQKRYINEYINHASITVLAKTISISGDNTLRFNITVPTGITSLDITGQIEENNGLFHPVKDIDPILSLKIFDPSGNVVAYASSPAVSEDKVFAETLICDHPGQYTGQISIYHGIKGGFFSARGLSQVNAKINVTISINQLSNSHYPLVPKLSMLAPYLSSVHAGIIVANESFGLTSDGYEIAASGMSAGPWYRELIHPFNNYKVNMTIQHLEKLFSILEEKNLLTSYLEGPAWLGILGDTNMIPMYYYGPSQPNLIEKGLPSDNPYTINQMLSTGRILAPSVSYASLLLCRTFFYETLCGPINNDDWFHSFHFIFGEGFGETGGIFHQIPYAKQITEYGFQPNVFGDFRNSRQFAEKHNIYSNANYIEYLGHGDWFWFTPSLYGFDIYSKAVDVAHVKNWEFERPNVFLTSACLMGRVDGISAQMNIGLNFIAAGSNGFIGATRTTGQEAGLEILENSLIIDDSSIGEALRQEKRNDKEMPTFVVRTLYGDPAFNPFEPNNGFSTQGIPMLNK